jgi:hypothetical protein
MSSSPALADIAEKPMAATPKTAIFHVFIRPTLRRVYADRIIMKPHREQKIVGAGQAPSLGSIC